MNIISGRYKGLQIKTNKRLPYRPTSSRVRKSIFDILGNLNDLSVLDIFAGSGILGFEAVSRGASEITFVDNNRKVIELIKINSNKFNEQLNANIICSKWDIFLKKNKLYDIIFADPPYHYMKEKYTDLIDSIFDLGKLNKEGLLVIEHEKKIDFNKHKMFYFEKKYGGTMLSFFKKASL